MSADDKKVNENFTKFVMEMKSYVSSDKKRVMMELTGISDEELNRILSYGTGPRIQIVDEGGGPAIYDPIKRDPKIIYVNKKYIENFPAVKGAKDGRAYSESYLLHEDVTYGEYMFNRGQYIYNFKLSESESVDRDRSAHQFNQKVYGKWYLLESDF